MVARHVALCRWEIEDTHASHGLARHLIHSHGVVVSEETRMDALRSSAQAVQCLAMTRKWSRE